MKIQKGSSRFWFEKYLRYAGYHAKGIIPRNEKRYWFYKCEENFFFMFKQEPFFKFGDVTNGKDVRGETINQEDLRFCIKNKVKKIFVLRGDGDLFFIDPEHVIILFIDNKAKRRPNWSEDKMTYTFPEDEMTKVMNLEELQKTV